MFLTYLLQVSVNVGSIELCDNNGPIAVHALFVKNVPENHEQVILPKDPAGDLEDWEYRIEDVSPAGGNGT